jgi:hypothetical protein
VNEGADEPRDLAENQPNGRDKATGRFQPGNRYGRGNPRSMARLVEARKAVSMATTPEGILAVLETLQARAMAGDVQAARVWLDRVCGKPREEPSGAEIPMDGLNTAAGVVAALGRIALSVTTGELSPAEGSAIGTLLRAVLDAGAVRDVEAELLKLKENGGRPEREPDPRFA